MSNNPKPRDIIDAYNTVRSRVSIPFTFTSVNENTVQMNDIDFHTVINKKANISSTKEYNNFINKYETDSGDATETTLPVVPRDLPPGFEETEDIT